MPSISQDLTGTSLIVNTDWPFSLGYEIRLSTACSLFVKEVRSKRKQMDALLSDTYSTRQERLDGIEGQMSTYPGPRIYLIYINESITSSARDHQTACVRLIELLSHEISHLVDQIIKQAAMEVVDTEVRAYLNDWLMGKFLHVTQDVLNLGIKDK